MCTCVVSETPTVLARVLLRVCAYSPGLFLQEPVAVTVHCIQKKSLDDVSVAEARQETRR